MKGRRTPRAESTIGWQPSEEDAAPITVAPSKTDLAKLSGKQERWRVSPETLGMMERVALAHYEVTRLTQEHLDNWEAVEKQAATLPKGSDSPSVKLSALEQVIEPIASSVWASSQIEGEAIRLKDVPVAIIGQAEPEDSEHRDDYGERVKGTRAIYSAYVWALAQRFPLEGGDVLTPAFICELHRRMFAATRGSAAGQIKKVENRITQNNRTVVLPLTALRAEEGLRAACDRINRSFVMAQDGRFSKLAATAEFLLDFLAVHPFADGNGRTVRLLSTYLLDRAGYHFVRFYSLDLLILARRRDYYQSLQTSQRNWATRDEDLTPWLTFYVEVVYQQMINARDFLLRRRDADMRGEGAVAEAMKQAAKRARPKSAKTRTR